MTSSPIYFEVTSLSNYFVKGKDILSSLTPTQYKCLEQAVENGYFDIPKKVDSRMLAKKRGISHSAYLAHIRKAQKKILEELFR